MKPTVRGYENFSDDDWDGCFYGIGPEHKGKYDGPKIGTEYMHKSTIYLAAMEDARLIAQLFSEPEPITPAWLEARGFRLKYQSGQFPRIWKRTAGFQKLEVTYANDLWFARLDGNETLDTFDTARLESLWFGLTGEKLLPTEK